MRPTAVRLAAAHYRILVLGGGNGGCAASHRFRKLVPKGQLAVVEPSDVHYYQPGFTLVGGGLMKLRQCFKPMASVLHKDNVWLKKSVAELHPRSNSVILDDGSEIKYDLLIVALGLDLRFDMVEGLSESLKLPRICSIYRHDLADKTYRELQTFSKGNAVFTLPNTPIKCSGAGQKICYLADEIFKKRGVRERINLFYYTYLPDVFDVPKYAKPLNEIIKAKRIDLSCRRSLKSIDPLKKEAVFDILNEQSKPNGQTAVQKYDLLHVAPPCSPVKPIRQCSELLNANGWLAADAETLQSTKFDNIFGIGDCLGTPNKKTSAATFSQMRALDKNIPAFLSGKKLEGHYNGYSSCPLIVSFNRVVLAEFTPKEPLETLPYDQGRPLYTAYLLKRYVLPTMYWTIGINGHWLGPATMRKVLRLGRS
ncbi:Sulfide:quinone oxidoreductase, mitochondrial [Toxocara canis]|uniref:Sulfide:quinone oxidoreductase, mitochondrial n=1 Tax=Toxocara canis TaxID=6265 RepID=A0A0B2VK33_TOXCA|nr:Sulfide:quinone oxidoreductase, mitochondrial [Toxocara canis]